MTCARIFLIVFGSILTSALPVLAGEPANLESLEVHGNVVDMRTEADVLIRLTFLDDDLLRIQATHGEEPTEVVAGRAPIVLPVEEHGVSVDTSGPRRPPGVRDLGDGRGGSRDAAAARATPRW